MQAEASLTYRFVSPVARQALRDQARLQAKAEAIVGVWVQIKDGAPQAYAPTMQAVGRDDEGVWPHPDAEPVTRLMSRTAVQDVRGGLPFLNGYLIHLKNEGWV